MRQFHGSARLQEPSINLIPPEKTRNIGIIAHIDAGKTTTTERMLFYSGKTARIGNVDQGDTVTDYLPSERLRGITIQLAAISIPWNNHKINIIDTPGHADFTFEVMRSLRVLDGSVTILDAVAGVEAQTLKVWRQAADLKIPRIAYINKMDRPGAGFSRTVREIVARLQTRVVCINLPFFLPTSDGEMEFRGLVDVIHQKLLVWDRADETGQSMVAMDIDSNLQGFPGVHDMLNKSRECMVETLGELDDSVIEEFFDKDENYSAVSAATLHKAIQKAVLAGLVTPVLCGSSFKNIGVQPLMDAVVAYLPSPLQAPIPEISQSHVKKTRGKSKLAKLHMPVSTELGAKGLVVNKNPNLTLALAFKVMSHPARGTLTFFRVYSGRLVSNTTVVNTRSGKKIHLKKLMLMHGDVPEEVKSILAGNIGVVAGTMDEISTGDTLVLHGVSSLKSFTAVDSSLKLMPIEIPPPLFNSSIEPATAGDARYMNECIEVLLKEDPSLSVHTDDEMGQTVLSGMGELHLEITRDRLVNDMKANVRLRDVAVSYKESVSKPDGSTATAEVENGEVYATISLDSFEGEAVESAFAEENGAIMTEVDNNIVVLSGDCCAPSMRELVENRRWKCESTLEELQEMLLAGLLTGLQTGGPIFGLPLHSCVVRVHLWGFPAEEKDVAPQQLLDVGRRAVNKAIDELYGKNKASFSILEPIMDTRVSVESDYMGEVAHDLNSRCLAVISSIDDDGIDNLEAQSWAHAEADKIYVPPDYTMKSAGFALRNKKVITAETPLREMVGYLSRLRSMTQGLGVFDMTYKGMRRATSSRMNSIKSEIQF